MPPVEAQLRGAGYSTAARAAEIFYARSGFAKRARRAVMENRAFEQGRRKLANGSAAAPSG